MMLWFLEGANAELNKTCYSRDAALGKSSQVLAQAQHTAGSRYTTSGPSIWQHISAFMDWLQSHPGQLSSQAGQNFTSYSVLVEDVAALHTTSVWKCNLLIFPKVFFPQDLWYWCPAAPIKCRLTKSLHIFLSKGTVLWSRTHRRARRRSSWRKVTLCLCTRSGRMAGTKGPCRGTAGRASSLGALSRASEDKSPLSQLRSFQGKLHSTRRDRKEKLDW